jgi:hypothetical protein
VLCYNIYQNSKNQVKSVKVKVSQVTRCSSFVYSYTVTVLTSDSSLFSIHSVFMSALRAENIFLLTFMNIDLSRVFLFLFRFPLVMSPQCENTLSAAASEAGSASMSRANGSSRLNC